MAFGAAAVTTVADFVARRAGDLGRQIGLDAVDPRPSTDVAGEGLPVTRRDRRRAVARRIASAGGVAAIVMGGVAVTTTWASRTTTQRLWRHRLLPDWGTGPLALTSAIVGWDFIYYWNHRFMHESRYMWAVHVVHHSSEHYNLSTALRQPVAEALGTFLPYGALCLLGISPELITTARGVNLLYQFWIHTEMIDRLGPPEAGPQHALPSPRPPRVQFAVSRSQSRQHWIVWTTLRHFRARGSTCRLWTHQEHRHIQPGSDRDARGTWTCCETWPGDESGALLPCVRGPGWPTQIVPGWPCAALGTNPHGGGGAGDAIQAASLSV